MSLRPYRLPKEPIPIEDVIEAIVELRSGFQVGPWTPRSPKWIELVQSLDCVISEAPGPNEAHHPVNGGKGLKCADMYAIPLSHDEHHRHHSPGQRGQIISGPEMWQYVARTNLEIITGARQ